jgi:hypothetical protein
MKPAFRSLRWTGAFRQEGGKTLRMLDKGVQGASIPFAPDAASLARLRAGLVRVVALAVVATFTGLAAGVGASPVRAAAPKVVVVVGPVGTSRTAEYIDDGRKVAAMARSYGASVVEIYSPNATWARVKQAAQGANVLVYLGHGNGWPSPYAPFSGLTKDGLGLNAVANQGHRNTKYYGETLVASEIRLAPDAVVLLHRLCYASGNSEPQHSDPTRLVAHRRVDNFGAGFLRAGARAVFAEAWKDPRYVFEGLFRTNKTFAQIFWSAPHSLGTYRSNFLSTRTIGARGVLDPYRAGGYYRSVVGWLERTAADWR